MLTTAPGSTRKSIAESLIQPARYHDSCGWTADIHVDKALIVARIDLDWGACVVNDPESDLSCASIKSTMCCAPISSEGMSSSTSGVFDTEICVCAHCSSDTEIMFCAHCSSVTEIMFCMHCSSDTEIMFCAHCSSGMVLFTVTELEICLISAIWRCLAVSACSVILLGG